MIEQLEPGKFIYDEILDSFNYVLITEIFLPTYHNSTLRIWHGLLFNNFISTVLINPKTSHQYLFDTNEDINITCKNINEELRTWNIFTKDIVFKLIDDKFKTKELIYGNN